MKLSSDTWRVRWNDDTIFYSYRWLAWALAGFSLAWPGHPPSSLPRNAGLLLLLGVITIAATAMAQGYVRLARRRPVLLLLDLIAGLTIVWLSGGATLPFLPYALGALLLPALLNGWAGALVAGVTFACLDITGIMLLSMAPSVAPTSLALGLRAAIPLAFACAWALLGQHLRQGERTSPSGNLSQVIVSPPEIPTPNAGDLVRMRSFEDLDRGTNIGAGRSGRPQNIPSQLEPGPRSEVARPAIFDPAPSESLAFPVAIEQLALSLGRQIGIEVRLTTIGAARKLTGAQHSLLLRVAQEALLNVQQHAHAHTVLMTLSYEPHAFALIVQDDGVGLLDGTYERPGMHALRAVRYRLAELDGQLAVFESESGGVTLRATLPVDWS